MATFTQFVTGGAAVHRLLSSDRPAGKFDQTICSHETI